MAGRIPKPTALKILNGSAAHDPQRINRDEPTAPALSVAPPAPAWLTKRAADEWAGLARDAMLLGVLTEADLRTVAATAAAFDEYISAADWHERDAAWRRYFTGLSRLGLNPSDRTRLHVTGKPTVDPMTALLTPKVRRA
ncbi:MAG: hypothetical protein ACRDGQ_06765 [Candidatus Limnocylindrales bacterium]